MCVGEVEGDGEQAAADGHVGVLGGGAARVDPVVLVTGGDQLKLLDIQITRL